MLLMAYFSINKKIFIGGNNSLIGPIEASFGAVSAASARLSHVIETGLNFGSSLHGKKNIPFQQKQMQVFSILKKQIQYLSELYALLFWYDVVRSTIAQGQEQTHLYRKGYEIVEINIQERIKQIDLFLQKNSQQSSIALWEEILKLVDSQNFIKEQPTDNVFESIKKTADLNQNIYTKTIQNLDDLTKQSLHQSLQNLVKYFDSSKYEM